MYVILSVQSPRCKMCSSHPVIKTSNHLFLDLAKVQPYSRAQMYLNFAHIAIKFRNFISGLQTMYVDVYMPFGWGGGEEGRGSERLCIELCVYVCFVYLCSWNLRSRTGSLNHQEEVQ